MGVRSAVAVALVASALLGFTVAVPQDTHVGAQGSPFRFLTGKGANVADGQLVHGADADVGSLLDRIDGRDLDPALLKNLDREAMADLLSRLTPEQLASLGLDPTQAAQMAAALRDPDLAVAGVAALISQLADRGLMFLNANGDGRFNGGEQAFADLDGDGRVSAGDVRLGILALLVSQDRELDPAARALLARFEAAGGLGLDTPKGASSRGNATALTMPMAAPQPYPTDRSGGPLAPVCVQVYSPSLTCHQRTFVQQEVGRQGDFYVFRPDDAGTRTPVALEPDAVGVRVKGTVTLGLDPAQWTPVPGLTPSDHLLSISGPSVALARDANGMLWAHGKETGLAQLALTWAVDMAYYDLDVPASATPQDVPSSMAPRLDSKAQAVGLRIASFAGADGRSYGGSLRALTVFLHSFQAGALPDRDATPDDLLAVAQSQVGCARQRSEAFVLAAQSLGIPARLVINEAHAFAEAWVPTSGWHMVDLGGCGQYQVATTTWLEVHQEVLTQQDLPFAAGQRPPSQVLHGEPVPTSIDITESPTALRRNSRFTIAGTVKSPAGPVPDGIPVTFTYNRTKQSAGTAFCSAQTAGGGYRGTCQLGPDTPAGSLQLVARLAPSAVADHPSTASYSDPPFTLQKATRLDLEGPTRTSAQTPIAYVVHLTDEDGVPVPYAAVTLQMDGGAVQGQDTDRDGRALFSLISTKGTHKVALRYAGDDGHDAANATRGFEATATRLVGKVDAVQLDQGNLRLAGTMSGASGALGGRLVRGHWVPASGEKEQVRDATTASDGSFKLAFTGLPPAGLGYVTLEGADGVAVGVGFTRAVTAAARLEVPAQWQSGMGVPVTIHLDESPVSLPLTILADNAHAGEAVVRPGSPATVLLDLAPGPHTIALRAEPDIHFTTDTASLQVGRFQAELDPVPVLGPGGTLQLAGTLRFEGQPVVEELRLRLLEAEAAAQSGQDGRFHLSLAVPADIPVGRAAALLEAPAIGLQQEVVLSIQRAAGLTLQAPALSFHAFGATPISIQGEGALKVLVEGVPADAGLTQVDSGTWLLRSIHVEATAVPTLEGVAPTTVSQDILVVNPLTLLGVPALAIGGTTAGLRLGRRARRARADRYRFLGRPQRLRVRILHPELPPLVPRVLDPSLDDVLRLRTRRKGPWVVRDGRGGRIEASTEGRIVTIPLAGLAPGLHHLRLEREGGRGRGIQVPIAVQPLRAALDDATHRLLQSLEGLQGAVTMEGLEGSLASHGVLAERARAVRDEAERALYAGPRCDRAAFHAFFAALDAAQAGGTA